ncbi:hypothetical protein DFH06DRAFT_1324972 [Mycena polygramma]|nr:hypothetical protein DFH06DRAFT_1324972 [Mycena polygramma]
MSRANMGNEKSMQAWGVAVLLPSARVEVQRRVEMGLFSYRLPRECNTKEWVCWELPRRMALRAELCSVESPAQQPPRIHGDVQHVHARTLPLQSSPTQSLERTTPSFSCPNDTPVPNDVQNRASCGSGFRSRGVLRHRHGCAKDERACPRSLFPVTQCVAVCVLHRAATLLERSAERALARKHLSQKCPRVSDCSSSPSVFLAP